MSANPGLRDISHSITGGSISAQGMLLLACAAFASANWCSGYWIPFEAAKAVAARLCYDIRYVLVPVFGPDFVAMCHRRDDPDFQILSVDRNIIQRCKEGATALQTQSRESSTASSPRTPSAFTSLPLWPPPKSLRAKPDKAADVESGYGTDTDRSDIYTSSPGSPTSISFTPVNTPRTPIFETYRCQPPTNITSTPRVNVSSVKSPKSKLSKRARTTDNFREEEPTSYQSSPEASAIPKRRRISPTSTSHGMTPETGAAYTLIRLNMADSTLTGERDVRRRRASA